MLALNSSGEANNATRPNYADALALAVFAPPRRTLTW